MSSNEILFAITARERPRRTYSHKGRNNRTASLPALKPTNQPSTDPGPRLQRFSIRHSNSWEVKELLPDATEQANANEDHRSNNLTHGTGTRSRERTEETSRSSIENLEEELTSPVTPSNSSQAFCESEETEIVEVEDEDDDDPITLSQSLNCAERTSDQTAVLRRCPFLIFDQIQSKGYKKLKHTSPPKTTLPLSKPQPGDGFSGREAKPNGLNLLMRNGKQQAVTSPHLGILDLTQSEPPTKQKRSLRKANLDDNSFSSVPRKKIRRRPETKDAPANAAKMAQPTVKESSSALKANPNTTTAKLAVQENETQNERGTHTKDNATGRDVPPNTSPQEKVPSDGLQANLDTAITRRSDEVPKEAGKPSRCLDTVEEGQDSCETHVSDTPPRQLRASSASSAASPRRDANVVTGVSQRVFRRFYTQ